MDNQRSIQETLLICRTLEQATTGTISSRTPLGFNSLNIPRVTRHPELTVHYLVSESLVQRDSAVSYYENSKAQRFMSDLGLGRRKGRRRLFY
jgi:hypothetical protein